MTHETQGETMSTKVRDPRELTETELAELVAIIERWVNDCQEGTA